MESLIQDMIQAGVPEDLAQEQCRLIERGVRYADLHASAWIENGITKLDASEIDTLVETYDQRSEEVKVLKFVPASGAATRMFKDLIAEWRTGESNPGSDQFFEQLKDIPFAHLLDPEASRQEILDHLLSTEHLDMDDRPKGSILFHRYPDEVRTAFEEHLVEGVEYASSGGRVHLHFTLSPDHIEDVKSSLHDWAEDYAQRLGCTYDLQFSIQLPFTDTVPFDLQGRPLMDGQRVLTRPGGHGSLIYNLNKLDADMIFIKNIDNVVPDRHRGDTVRYKKALAGMLMEARKEARAMISELKASDDEETRARAILFLERMGLKLEIEPGREQLIQWMNRPYRVCGMVKNQGEPGGGPFWVNEGRGKSLQIVESAQIDAGNQQALDMLNSGTHFNPVDIVCSLNDLYGMRQDLLRFVDKDSAFVTQKVIQGQEAMVIEWPGLWNGAMADWNTMFVEVPVSTFNPVKRVTDLLRPFHQ